MAVLDRMVDEFDRAGRASGKGFYDYEDNRRTRLWPELTDRLASGNGGVVSFVDLQDRLLFAMALDAARCFEEGVITSTAAANIGSIFGIGFPANKGGVAQFIENYEGGVAGFIARAQELADSYGERFRPSAWLVERAGTGRGLAG